jgi:hypothetical protein
MGCGFRPDHLGNRLLEVDECMVVQSENYNPGKELNWTMTEIPVKNLENAR